MDYGVFKAGLLYLTKALARQYVPHVRVNAVLPGPIWSQMWTRPGGILDQLVAAYGVGKEEALKRFLAERQMPLGMGEPIDVAHAVAFLASPVSKFITGASLDLGGTLAACRFVSLGNRRKTALKKAFASMSISRILKAGANAAVQGAID